MATATFSANPLIHLTLVTENPRSERVPFDRIRLRDARLSAGLSATEVAAVVGATERTLFGWESGSSYPQTRFLPRIERLLASLLVVVA